MVFSEDLYTLAEEAICPVPVVPSNYRVNYVEGVVSFDGFLQSFFPSPLYQDFDGFQLLSQDIPITNVSLESYVPVVLETLVQSNFYTATLVSKDCEGVPTIQYDVSWGIETLESCSEYVDPWGETKSVCATETLPTWSYFNFTLLTNGSEYIGQAVYSGSNSHTFYGASGDSILSIEEESDSIFVISTSNTSSSIADLRVVLEYLTIYEETKNGIEGKTKSILFMTFVVYGSALSLILAFCYFLFFCIFSICSKIKEKQESKEKDSAPYQYGLVSNYRV